jgi:hypothetical protein
MVMEKNGLVNGLDLTVKHRNDGSDLILIRYGISILD